MSDSTSQTTAGLPDLWDAEACGKWLEERMQESLRSLLESHDGLTSRFCDTCGKAWFFPPGNPTGCPHCPVG